MTNEPATSWMGATAPRVSIIIPTHDRPALLQRSLASALAQATSASIEVIVIDDGSEPPVVLDADPVLRLVRTENRGASAARNVGLERAGGAFVLFLDSDDWLEPDAVANLLGTIEARQAAVAFGAWRNVSASTGEANVVRPPRPYADGLASILAGGWVAGSFLMARAAAARFDPSLKVWEVTRFLCDSLASGAAVAICDAVVVNIAQHDDPRRISIRHDHFEPLTTARAFAAMKATLAGDGTLNDERRTALDTRLLACLHALVRDGRDEATDVYRVIDWAHIARQATYRPGSFSWCARWGGLAGARGFMKVSRALGR